MTYKLELDEKQMRILQSALTNAEFNYDNAVDDLKSSLETARSLNPNVSANRSLFKALEEAIKQNDADYNACRIMGQKIDDYVEKRLRGMQETLVLKSPRTKTALENPVYGREWWQDFERPLNWPEIVDFLNDTLADKLAEEGLSMDAKEDGDRINTLVGEIWDKWGWSTLEGAPEGIYPEETR